MKWYFENEERRRQLLWEAGSWVGTPFRGHSQIKGVGVDCVHLAAALYIATGVVKEFNPPAYSLDRSRHRDDSLILPYMEGLGVFCETAATITKLLPGDLLCFHVGRSEHHVGVVTDDYHFLHAPCGYCALYSRLQDSTYQKRLTKVYRPIAREGV
jgi:cell wall-associated NlpC family hydrolase